MLTLLLGTDWTANRDTILSMLKNEVAQQKSGRILIVPELISHDTERRFCAVAGNTCSRFAEVLSFTRLVDRVDDYIDNVNGQCLDNGGRVVAMAAAVKQLHSKLKAYASVETRPEFLESLVDAVDEFKRCCISAEDLMLASRETSGTLAQKLQELSLILDSYNGICARGKRDPRDQMTVLLEELEASTFGQEHVFYIDGFPDFTRQHMEILKHVILTSPSVTICLTCDKPGSRRMGLEKAGQTAWELLTFAKEHSVAVNCCNVPERKDDLSNVRRLLFQGSIDGEKKQDNLQLFHAETIHQECIYVIDRIVSLVQQGARYRDISVVCADMDTYRSMIEMAFRRSHIPLYISGTEDILEKNLMATVLSGIEAALSGFEQEDVLHYMKSALSPIDQDLCDRVENYVLLWGITGSNWQTTWVNHPDGLGYQATDASVVRLQKLNDARVQIIEPLARLRDGFNASTNVGQQLNALYAFLKEISIDSRLRALADEMDTQGDNRNAQILNQLWEILMSALEQLHDVLCTMTWDAETFTRLFKVLLHQYDVGTIPPVLDSVTVGPVSAMRCQQSKHVIVIGALEGNLPKYSGATGVLTDQERTVLREIGVPLTGGALEGLQAEFAEIYGVICGAEESVDMTAPAGQTCVVYRRLAKLAGGETVPDVLLGAALTDKTEAGVFLVRHKDNEAADLLGIHHEYEQMNSQICHQLGSVTRENIDKLYGSVLNLSASQVDRQAQCRMMYFLRHGLGVKERKTAEVDPAEFGTYVHAVLEQTVREIVSLGGFRHVSVDDALAIADKYSKEYAKERFSELSSQRVDYLFERNTHELALIVRELWMELRESDFVPVGFEVGFGEGMDVPPIDVSGKTMQARLRGFVDRVDAWKNDGRPYFRVVDYKTGKKDFDYCDIYNGYGLQMLLYLFALEDGGDVLLGSDATPAGVQYFPARVPLVPADGKITDDEATAARNKMWKRKGLLLLSNDVLSAMDKTESQMRLPITRKSDGSISGDVANKRQFALLKTYIFCLVSQMVDEIASGEISPNPYSRGTNHDACRYCPYEMICHKQDVTDRRNYKAVSAEKFWADLEREVTSNG